MKLRALFLFFVATLVLPAVAAAATSTPQAPRPSCIMAANPGAVEIGGTVTLSWQSQNATEARISTLGSVDPNGRQGVIPTAYSNTYVGTFTGPGGSVTCSYTVGIVRSAGGGGSGGENGSGNGTGVGASSGKSAADPRYTTGRGLLPCGGPDCQACHLAGLTQSIINWLVGISIPLAAAMFAYAGILYFTSSTLHRIDDAHKIFKSVGIGFLIVISAWLGIQTILKTILSDNYYRSWNTIQCVPDGQRPINKSIGELLAILPMFNSSSQVSVGDTPVGAGTEEGTGAIGQSSVYACEEGTYNPDDNGCYGSGEKIGEAILQTPPAPSAKYNDDISSAIDRYKGTNTSAGPDQGNLACAWSLNNVLADAGQSSLDGAAVSGVQDALERGGRGELIPSSDVATMAQKGDIVVWKEGAVSHVGFCYNDGCSETISNGGRRGDTSFDNMKGLVDRGVVGKVYRLK